MSVLDDTHLQVTLGVDPNAQTSSSTARAMTLTAPNGNTVTIGEPGDPMSLRKSYQEFPESTQFDLYIADPTPVITSVSLQGTLTAGDPTGADVLIDGDNFGQSWGTLDFCTPNGLPTPCEVHWQISNWDPIAGKPGSYEVRAHLTADSGALGNYYVQLTANSGRLGQEFQPTPGGQTKAQSGPGGPVQIYLLSVRQTPSSLALSTGDTNTIITTSVTPAAYTFAPTFSWGLQSNPNSSCSANLGFSGNGGTGTVNTIVTAAPAGCSGIFSAEATVGTRTSGVFTQIVVPPQIMIQTAVGEAGGQTAPGDTSIPSLLLVAKNRFGDGAFPGGTTGTWQAVLVASQFYGAGNTTANGVEPELDHATSVFTATTPVTIPSGCKAFWSPTNSQFTALQTWAGSAANTVTDDMWADSSIGAPRLWLGQPKQAVIKNSIGYNIRPGYTSAPAFVLFRVAPSPTDPAILIIP